jgi:phage gpG-like protein
LIDLKAIIKPNLNRIADVVRVRIGGSATGTYMRDSGATTPEAQKALGRNKRRGAGALRIVSGRLARSLTGSRTGGNVEGSTEAKLSGNSVSVTMKTDVPYANVHEYGFTGSIQVPQHQRRITQAFGRELDSPKTVQVRGHSRQVSIPKRPYLEPAKKAQLPKIKERVTEIVATDLVKRLRKIYG